VTLILELLNSKKDHNGYEADRTWWGVDVCAQVGSPRVKLLYDIYHMQIMEGDVIATVREHHTHFAHYHTAGVPGRRDLDTNQELFYPAIARAIAETGFDGFIGHEFLPKGETIPAMEEAFRACDV
jgi:hydroxypyruvate isomerase